MINKKRIIIGISLFLIHNINAAEGKKLGTPNAGAITAYVQGYIPTTALLYNVANAGLNMLTSSANSAIETASNYLSDDKALNKLGYISNNINPNDFSVNNEELQKWVKVRDRHTEALANYTINKTSFLEDINKVSFKDDVLFIARRQAYVQRACTLLSTDRPDVVNIALFCLTHYMSLMNSYESEYFRLFSEAKEELSKSEAHKIAAQLNSLSVSKDSQLLQSRQSIQRLSNSVGSGHSSVSNPKPDGEK